jgi:hypothetical protein
MAEAEVKKDPNDPTQRLSREEAMAVVRESHEARRKSHDIGEPETPTPAHAAAPAVEDPDADRDVTLDPGAQVSRQTAEPLILADADLGKYKVPMKVNGEERMVTLDELRASAQKNEAADDYLRDAREKAREIVDEARRTAATPAPAAEAAPVATATSTATPASAVDVDSAIDKLFQGETDDVKRLLKEVVARPATPAGAPVDVDQLAASVEQKVVVRSALRQFAKDYPAIVKDPIARGVADRFLSQEAEGKPLEAYSEEKIGQILAATGKRVVEWTRTLAGVSANGPLATTRDDKEKRKETIDELPATGARAQTHVPQPRTNSDVISAMAKARGQDRGLPQP